MSVAFAPEAVDDLAAAVEYLREHHPRTAAATADAVFAAIDKLAAREFEGPENELRITRTAFFLQHAPEGPQTPRGRSATPPRLRRSQRHHVHRHRQSQIG